MPRLASLFARDLQLGSRRLLRSPLFTLFAIASLAIGVAATTAVYSLIQAALWPATGVPDESRVIVVATPTERGGLRWRNLLSRADFADLKAQLQSLEAVAASASTTHALTIDGVTTFQSSEVVTAGYFGVLGTGTVLGRTFGPADDAPDAPSVMVISEAFWRRTLLEDPHAIGRVVRYGDQPFEIVGVAASGFGGLARLAGPQRRTDLWIPMAAIGRIAGAFPPATDRGALLLSVIGRLSDEALVEPVMAETAAIAARLDAVHPAGPAGQEGGSRPPRRDWTARTLADARGAPPGVHAAGAAIVGLAALVLVVASTNLANLTLARGSARAVEIAVRRALGAARVRLVGELAAESTVVGLAGGAAALLGAQWLIDAIARGVSIGGATVAERFDPRVDWRVFLFAIGAVLIAFVVSGLAPALRLTRTERTGALGRDASGAGTRRWRGQRRLILAQVAISTALLLLAALGVSMVAAAARDDSGVDMDRLAMGVVIFRGPAWDDGRVRSTLDRVMDALSQEPGVEAAAVSFGFQIGPRSGTWVTAAPEGGQPDMRQGGVNVYFVPGSPNLLSTIGVPIVRGRGLTDRDAEGTPAVAVISERAARLLFGTADAAGRTILWRGGLNIQDRTTIGRLTVVGIARDTATGSNATRNDGVIYVPIAQHPLTPVPPYVIVRHGDQLDGRSAATLVQTAIRRAAPDLPIIGGGTAMQILAEPLLAWRTVSLVATSLGAVASLLTLVGLYGVLAHVVARRTREMGVRIALGASRGQVLGLVLREGLKPVATGIAIGLFLGIVLRVAARSILADAPDANEPVVFAAVSIALLLAGAAACLAPARRASRVDPNVALRDL
jgi:predicted permease